MASDGKQPTREQREQRLRLLEDDIGRALAESASSGELRSAPSYGRPLYFGDGYAATPEALRMPMKVLRDAGVVPPEVEQMRQIAALRQQAEALDAAGDAAGAAVLRRQAHDLGLALALRLEKLRQTGSL